MSWIGWVGDGEGLSPEKRWTFAGSARGKVPASAPKVKGLALETPEVDILLRSVIRHSRAAIAIPHTSHHVPLSRSQAGLLSGLAPSAADLLAPLHSAIEQRLTHNRRIKHSRSATQLFRRKSRYSPQVDIYHIRFSCSQQCSSISTQAAHTISIAPSLERFRPRTIARPPRSRSSLHHRTHL